MLSLRKKVGRVLEPACGDGAFSNKLDNCLSIEFDSSVCPKYALNIDFFCFNEQEKFSTVIGNPPYVRYQDIPPTTRKILNSNLFDGRSNLYLFFIEKCIRHLEQQGELIFITPRDFLKATSSIKLNRWLYELGTITHVVDLGDVRVFDGATPNCMIWRFVRGEYSRRTCFFDASNLSDIRFLQSPTIPWEIRNFVESAGHLHFTKVDYPIRANSIFFVKVGAVSGNDAIFAHEVHGNQEFVCSETCKTGRLKRMIYGERAKYLNQFKDKLLSRKIKRFDEDNWWTWGRDCYHSEAPRVYVNVKTRNPHPFFVHECKYYDGSVLAIFPKNPSLNVHNLCEALNSVDWAELGFMCDDRYIFSQRSLENAPLPEVFFDLFPPKQRLKIAK